jgi:hypothetical protein
METERAQLLSEKFLKFHSAKINKNLSEHTHSNWIQVVFIQHGAVEIKTKWKNNIQLFACPGKIIKKYSIESLSI